MGTDAATKSSEAADFCAAHSDSGEGTVKIVSIACFAREFSRKCKASDV